MALALSGSGQCLSANAFGQLNNKLVPQVLRDVMDPALAKASGRKQSMCWWLCILFVAGRLQLLNQDWSSSNFQSHLFGTSSDESPCVGTVARNVEVKALSGGGAGAPQNNLVASAMLLTPCGRTTVGDRGAVRVLAELAGAWTTVGLSTPWPNWLGRGQQWGCPRLGRIGWGVDDSGARATVWSYVSGGYRNVTF